LAIEKEVIKESKKILKTKKNLIKELHLIMASKIDQLLMSIIEE